MNSAEKPHSGQEFIVQNETHRTKRDRPEVEVILDLGLIIDLLRGHDVILCCGKRGQSQTDVRLRMALNEVPNDLEDLVYQLEQGWDLGETDDG